MTAPARADHTSGRDIECGEQRGGAGANVRVRLHLGEQAAALLVPDVAVNSSQLGSYVYVVGRGNRIEQRYVALGAGYGPFVIADHGVRAGEYVLVGDPSQVSPGMRVRPLPQPAPKVAGAEISLKDIANQ